MICGTQKIIINGSAQHATIKMVLGRIIIPISAEFLSVIFTLLSNFASNGKASVRASTARMATPINRRLIQDGRLFCAFRIIQKSAAKIIISSTSISQITVACLKFSLKDLKKLLTM